MLLTLQELALCLEVMSVILTDHLQVQKTKQKQTKNERSLSSFEILHVFDTEKQE